MSKNKIHTQSFLGHKTRIGCFFVVLVCVGMSAHAIEIMSSADVMESKSWSITAYGRQVETEPELRNGSTDLNFDAQHEASSLMVTVRPGDNLHYRFLFGVLRNYELEVDSSTFVNKHESHSEGRQYGMGVRWNASPETWVSLGAAFDLSYVHQSVDFDRLQSNGVATALDERFMRDEFQLAVNISKRFDKVSPYGGVKVNYVETKVVDHLTQTSLYGDQVGWSPFVGLSWEFFPKEILTVEASLADEKSLAAGLNIKF